MPHQPILSTPNKSCINASSHCKKSKFPNIYRTKCEPIDFLNRLTQASGKIKPYRFWYIVYRQYLLHAYAQNIFQVSPLPNPLSITLIRLGIEGSYAPLPLQRLDPVLRSLIHVVHVLLQSAAPAVAYL